MSHLPIWYLGNLSDDLCDKVIEELSTLESKEAAIGSEGKFYRDETRKTTVRFADKGYWLEKIFDSHMLDANRHCRWEYHVTMSERVQFAEYGPGHHYTWHTDTFTLAGKETDRKITVICLLNDGFEGGDFEMRLYKDYVVPMKKGVIIAFPSILLHRVTPVTKGVRYSATMWFSGPRFR